MPLAKSTQVNEPAPVTPRIENTGGVMTYENLPIGVYQYFGEDAFNLPAPEREKLTDIYKWAENKVGAEGTTGDVMMKITALENQLGAPGIGEKKYDKMWRWCKLAFKIDDLDKRRKALEYRRF